MKIWVDKDPIANAKINLLRFVTELKKHLDIKKSIIESTIITKCGAIKEKEVIDHIYYNTDWNNILMCLQDVRHDEMTITIYKCKVIGWSTYEPIVIDPDEGSFELKPKLKVIDDLLVTNSFNTRIDKHIEFMLSQHIIDYANKKWNITLKFE